MRAYALPPARFWYLNHRGSLEYRHIQITQEAHFIEAPSFGYDPGWFVSGYALDREDSPLRSFSLDPKGRMGFADPTHWTAQGNNSPVLNCSRVFGVDYGTALYIAHQRTHGTNLDPVGMDSAVNTMRPFDLNLRGLFYSHLEAIAKTWHGFGRAA